MISFQMVLMDPNSEVRENHQNRNTLWSYKLTSNTYAGNADEMKRTLASDSKTLLPHDRGVLGQVIYLWGIRVLICEMWIITQPSSFHRTIITTKGKTQVNMVLCKPKSSLHYSINEKGVRSRIS